MNDKEKIQDIFNRFYNYNEETQKVKKEFLENKDSCSELLQNALRAICEIEEQLNISFAEQYKEFLKAEIGNYIYNPDSIIDEFRAYDAKELYEFNYVGEKVGHSAIEELKDFLIVGQDEGECSYFFDIHDTLGRGIDTFWRVNRSSCSNFQIVGNTFIDFLNDVANRKAIDAITPFEQKEEPIPENVKDILVEKLSGQISADELHSIDGDIMTIKNYLAMIRQKDDLFCLSKYWNEHIATLIKLHDVMNDTFPHSFVFILLKLENFSFSLFNISFQMLLDERLEAFNIGKKAKKYLKDMFIFAYNSNSLFLNINGSYFDYFFIDPTNKLGNGTDAIYVISEKSKKLEEACYVAKDIVDLFRLFAEGDELNTTPIGKAK